VFKRQALYRAENGQISRLRAVIAVVTVVVSAVIAVYANGRMWWLIHVDQFPAERAWLGGLVLALAFFGAGMLLRRRRVPGWLAWLGAVSYSVYLLHYVVIYLFSRVIVELGDNPMTQRLGFAAVYLATLLGLSYLCYRFVEVPFQSLGRRVVRRLRRPAVA
jgi:peptidoglycan/LPS O-acetylase OafA/YrhL